MKLQPYTIRWKNGATSYVMGESFAYAHKVAKAHNAGYRYIFRGLK